MTSSRHTKAVAAINAGHKSRDDHYLLPLVVVAWVGVVYFLPHQGVQPGGPGYGMGGAFFLLILLGVALLESLLGLALVIDAWFTRSWSWRVDRVDLVVLVAFVGAGIAADFGIANRQPQTEYNDFQTNSSSPNF